MTPHQVLPESPRVWLCADKRLKFTRPLVMGILNVTPDSFSDGGRNVDLRDALVSATEMVDARADIIDIGGVSTRPNYSDVSEDEEAARVLPVLSALRKEFPSLVLSVDTFNVNVAQRALDAGADIINDQAATSRGDLRVMPELAARYRAGLVLMHAPQGLTRTDCVSADIVGDVCAQLHAALVEATAVGVDSRSIVLDPGFGFGKTMEQNAALIRDGLEKLTTFGLPVLAAVSRKRFVRELFKAEGQTELLRATVLTNVMAFINGASIFRVHDVAAHVQAFEAVMKLQRVAGNATNDR